jgi:hypothetical protein
MSTKESTKIPMKDLDQRVRERHIASGKIDAKAVEKYLNDLPDLEASTETVNIAQPALIADDED